MYSHQDLNWYDSLKRLRYVFMWILQSSIGGGAYCCVLLSLCCGPQKQQAGVFLTCYWEGVPSGMHGKSPSPTCRGRTWSLATLGNSNVCVVRHCMDPISAGEPWQRWTWPLRNLLGLWTPENFFCGIQLYVEDVALLLNESCLVINVTVIYISRECWLSVLF